MVVNDSSSFNHRRTSISRRSSSTPSSNSNSSISNSNRIPVVDGSSRVWAKGVSATRLTGLAFSLQVRHFDLDKLPKIDRRGGVIGLTKKGKNYIYI